VGTIIEFFKEAGFSAEKIAFTGISAPLTLRLTSASFGQLKQTVSLLSAGSTVVDGGLRQPNSPLRNVRSRTVKKPEQYFTARLAFIEPYQRPKLSDPTPRTRGLQPERDCWVRCGAWLRGCVVFGITIGGDNRESGTESANRHWLQRMVSRTSLCL
jgi:hypothetical protein